MKITKQSAVTGNFSSMEIDVTQSQLDRLNGGSELIQNVLPNLNADEREFIKTGITKVEWDNIFGVGE